MTRFFATVGMLISLLYFMGAIGAIDFRLCVKPVGQCKVLP